MTTFTKSLHSWKTPEFKQTLRQEILQLDASDLPLQQALSQSSYVSESKFSVNIQTSEENDKSVVTKVGIFFTGIIAGSCCSDDPTPVDELQEYCEVQFKIDKETAEVTITLLET